MPFRVFPVPLFLAASKPYLIRSAPMVLVITLFRIEGKRCFTPDLEAGLTAGADASSIEQGWEAARWEKTGFLVRGDGEQMAYFW